MKGVPFALIAVLGFATLLLAPTASANDQQSRPKIGLALSGGAAKGCAHVGVLRELERLRIPIDYVAGTSMGAIIGAMYVSGMSVDEMERVLVQTDWDDILEDRTDYRRLTWRRKEDRQRYVGALEAGLKGRKLLLPTGIRSGQKLMFFLQELTYPVAYVRDFDELPIPFRAVATDVESGREVVLDHGSLPQAIRASMSIPALFTPVEYDGRLLIDGAFSNNLPIDLVRSMGADIVVAVDVSQPLASRQQLESFLGIMAQTSDYVTRKNTEAQLPHADIVLTPNVRSYGALAFGQADAIITRGREEAARHEGELSPLSATEEVWSAHVRRRRQPARAPEEIIAFLRVEGNERVDKRLILRRMRVRPGSRLDFDVLRRDLLSVYGMDEFEKIDVRFVEEDGRKGLVLQVREKPWGPTYLRNGLQIADDLSGHSSFTFIGNLTRTALNARGGELRVDFLIGSRRGFLVELYQPLDFSGKYFIAPAVELRSEIFGAYEGNRRVADYEIDYDLIRLDVGREIGTSGALRLGVSRGRVRLGLETGQPILTSASLRFGAADARLTIDRTDSPIFPRTGWAMNTFVTWSLPPLGAEERYTNGSTNLARYIKLGRGTALVAADAGARLSDSLPGHASFSVGGLLSIGGFAPGQFSGDSFAIGRLGYYHEIGRMPSAIGRGIYTGFLVEGGNVWPSLSNATFDELLVGTTLFVGAETILGPIVAAGSMANGQTRSSTLRSGERSNVMATLCSTRFSTSSSHAVVP